VPEEMVLKTNLIGTEEMVRERLRAYRDAGVNTLRLSTSGKDWKARTQSLEEAVDLVKREAALW
jgi:alkanesulfonate monooxygenase SsuD/methylene tetrahydromethanopterin reductase-like flavin-dependent oxidoreductase (luciferase family)